LILHEPEPKIKPNLQVVAVTCFMLPLIEIRNPEIDTRYFTGKSKQLFEYLDQSAGPSLEAGTCLGAASALPQRSWPRIPDSWLGHLHRLPPLFQGSPKPLE
jgi:hypothetical protein